MLSDKKILVAVCGSIAAFKTAFFIRLLKKSGAEVKVIMTESASDFITPLTLATLSKNPVYAYFFEFHHILPKNAFSMMRIVFHSFSMWPRFCRCGDEIVCVRLFVFFYACVVVFILSVVRGGKCLVMFIDIA